MNKKINVVCVCGDEVSEKDEDIKAKIAVVIMSKIIGEINMEQAVNQILVLFEENRPPEPEN